MTQFAEQRELGRRYEVAFAEWLRCERGYLILPTYDYSGKADNKAPRLAGAKQSLVIPDIMAFREGQTQPQRWFEIKWKQKADLYRVTNTPVTGIPLRHYQHYREVKVVTCAPVYLIFIHQDEGKVIGGEIDAIEFAFHHEYTGGKMSRGGMRFYNFDKLPFLVSLRTLQHYLNSERK